MRGQQRARARRRPARCAPVTQDRGGQRVTRSRVGVGRARAACPRRPWRRAIGAPASGQSMPSAGSFHSSVRSCSRIPVVGRLVEELGGVGQHEEAVRESRRDPQHPLVRRPTARTPTQRPNVGEPRRRSTATSNTSPAIDAHQLALRVLDLVVQPAQHAARASASGCPARTSASMPGRRERARVPALEEEAALVAEHARLDQQHVGQSRSA